VLRERGAEAHAETTSIKRESSAILMAISPF